MYLGLIVNLPFLPISKKQDTTLCILPRFYFPSNSPSIILVGPFFLICLYGLRLFN